MGTFGSRELITKCTKAGSMGLNFHVDVTGKSMLIKFHHLIDHPLDIMFWNIGKSLSQSSVICQRLKDCKDIPRMKLMGLWYLNEYYGDAAPMVTIINHICTFIKEGELTAVTKVIKKAEISTEWLVKELELKANNPAFVEF